MEPFTRDFDDIVAKTLKKWHAPGITFSVVRGDKTWSKAYGLARLPAEPTTTSTLYYVCSTTKAILCAAWALYLASPANIGSDALRRISWTTPIAEIIRDDFVLEDPVNTNAITLEDCLSHRTGMSRHEPSYGRPGVETSKDIHRMLLEIATGKSNAETFRDYLWAPLGMQETFGGMPKEFEIKQHVVATGYTFSKFPGDEDEASGELRQEPNLDLEAISGAGYVMSTADHYAKWMRCLLNGDGPLTSETIKELWTPRAIVPDEDELRDHFDGVICYCLGWFKATYRGEDIVWHPGGVNGAGSCVLLLPAHKWGVTFFANIHAASATMNSLLFWLVDDLLGTPASERKSAWLDERFVTSYKKSRDSLAARKKKLHPDPSNGPTLPLALPLQNYAGAYTHPGYGTITFVPSSDAEGAYLYARLTRTFGAEYAFRHVNGEHWLGTRWASVWPVKGALRARSSIDASGKVEGFDIAMEAEMPDTMMRFARTE